MKRLCNSIWRLHRTQDNDQAYDKCNVAPRDFTWWIICFLFYGHNEWGSWMDNSYIEYWQDFGYFLNYPSSSFMDGLSYNDMSKQAGEPIEVNKKES